jgi:hypothetical protein
MQPTPAPTDGPKSKIFRSEPSHGEFFGYDLTWLECEAIHIANIEPKFRKRESALFRTRWFDYRNMHPVLATYYCVHEYNNAYRHIMSQMKDRRWKYANGFKGEDFMATRELKSFWRLRQMIDSIGMRYDFFMRHGMNWYLSAGWIQAPRPAHLLKNEEMIVEVGMKWEEELAAKIQFCRERRYKVANFVGHEDQIAYERFLIEQIKLRAHPHYALSAALYECKNLRIERAMEHFEQEVIQRAIECVGAC